MDKFLKYANSIIALYTYIYNDKILGIGNSYMVEMPNSIFTNISDTYMITTRHLQSLLLLPDLDNLDVTYADSEILIKKNNIKLNLPIINDNQTLDTDTGNKILEITDQNILNRIYKFKKMYKEAEILLNSEGINCTADNLSLNIDYLTGVDLPREIHLHYILGLINPDKLEIYENAIVAYDDNIKLIAFESILEQNPELVLDESISDDNFDL